MFLGANNFSTFATIVSDVGMRDACKEKDEIRFMEQDNGTVVCSYLVSMESTFNTPFCREARGIVFDNRGFVISRPLHKFFNVGEKESTRVENLDWNKVVRVMDKRDGSMIHTVDFPSELGNFSLKSKKSYSSDVAVLATKFMKSRENYKQFCHDMVEGGYTAIFEWTSPTSRIVLHYSEDDMMLLHVRDNITGKYLDKQSLENASKEYNIPLVKEDVDTLTFLKDSLSSGVGIDKIIDTLKDTKNVEGWVFQFDDGDMVKLKTTWYMERHRAMTFLRERDVALMVLRESLDDLKALLVGEGASISEILDIEKRTVTMVEQMIKSVEDTYQADKELDRKTFAMKHQNVHTHFGLLMQRFTGKEPDYMGHFERRHLAEEFTLRQINVVQSVAEVE